MLEPTAQFIADYADYTPANDYRNSDSDSDSVCDPDFLYDYGYDDVVNATRWTMLTSNCYGTILPTCAALSLTRKYHERVRELFL